MAKWSPLQRPLLASGLTRGSQAVSSQGMAACCQSAVAGIEMVRIRIVPAVAGARHGDLMYTGSHVTER